MCDRSWQQLDSDEQRRHEEEIARDWDELQLDVYLGFWHELEKLMQEEVKCRLKQGS